MPIYFRFCLIGILCMLTGIYTFTHFRALSSIGIAILFVTAIFYYKGYKNFFREKAFWLISLVFIIYLTGYIKATSDNVGESMQHLIMKAPFVLLAFSFAVLPPISKKRLLDLYYYFFLLTALAATGTLINFLANYEAITESYKASKIMPTPINHVRFSIIIAFSIFIGAYLWYKNYSFKYKWEKAVIIFFTLFLFIFIHVLSVRSGLLSLYVTLFFTGIFFAFKTGRYKLLIPATGLLIILPVVAYFLVPTFENKIQNTIQDLKSIDNKGSANNYSIAGRIISYKVAWQIFTENPVTGIGSGNLQKEVERIYTVKYPEIHNEGIGILMPHNQFLIILATAGITGLLAFLFCFYSPLVLYSSYSFPLLVIHYVIISISFMFEGTLETQTGSVFTLVFIFLPMFYLKQYFLKKDEKTVSSYNYV